MDFIKYTILGDEWCIYITDNDDNVVISEVSEAEVDFNNKEIWFRSEDIKLVTVKHELFHVFIGYTYTASANLSFDQMEEIACEIFAYKGDQIASIAKDILSKLKQLKSDNGGNKK